MLHSGQLLTALSYRSVLARGFALVRNDAGHPLHAAADVLAGARLELEFSDGRVAATAGRRSACAEPATGSPSPRRASERQSARPSVGRSGQFVLASLFADDLFGKPLHTLR